MSAPATDTEDPAAAAEDDGPDVEDLAGLSGRDVKALTECMSVLPETGEVRGVPGMYLVVSQTGNEYVVDLGGADPRCQCRDHQYRQSVCKHIRRVRFATRRRPIPNGIQVDAVDPMLGHHCGAPKEDV